MRFRIIVLFWMVSVIMDVEAFYPNSFVSFLSNGDYTQERITERGLSRVFQELWNQSSNSFSKQNIRGKKLKTKQFDDNISPVKTNVWVYFSFCLVLSTQNIFRMFCQSVLKEFTNAVLKNASNKPCK